MSVTGLLVKSFALGMAFMALLLVSYYYMSLKQKPETMDETPEIKPYVPPKPHAYNWAKDERYGVLKGKKEPSTMAVVKGLPKQFLLLV